MPTVARQFARTLKEIGVRFVFGVPSGNMTDYMEALRLEEGIEFVLVGHESTASFMAGVCGRLTGIPGVCFGTFGPGATNLSTGVGGALLDRFPLLAFTDEMPEHLRNRTVQMNMDHQAFFTPITKWTASAQSDTMDELILKAAGISLAEKPGPVHIGVPAGIGLHPVKEPDKQINYLRLEKQFSREDLLQALTVVRQIFVNSQKPVLAVGLSAVRTQAKDLIVRIAEKFGLPVVLTPMAKGMFPENHPLYAGVLFHAQSNLVAKIYREADLVIGIGYDPVEFNYEDWMPRVPLIHLDTVKADIEEKYTDVTNLEGEINVLLGEFLTFQGGLKNWDQNQLVNLKNDLFSRFIPENNSFGPLAVVHELRKALPENGVLTVDVGAHLHLIGQMWRTPSPEKLLMTNGWSSMGFAIPAALAAKLCHPELPVAALMGDGGFLMAAGELATAKRLNLNIVFIVIYDSSLSLIRIKQSKKNYNPNYGTDLNKTTEIPANHYFGVPVISAVNLTGFQNAITDAFSANGPVVIEAVVDGNEYDKLVLKANR